MKHKMSWLLFLALWIVVSVSAGEVNELGEQVVRLPGRFAMSEVAAISFPSSKVLVHNAATFEMKDERRLAETFHVLCVLVDGRAECVSTLEEHGIYIEHASLMDECFEAPSADARFVIATPVRNNVCVLNVTLSREPGMIERLFNVQKPVAERKSIWSIDAPVAKERVNAYKRVIGIMKKHHLDFETQIINRNELLPFDNLYDMIEAEVANRKPEYRSAKEFIQSSDFSPFKNAIRITTMIGADIADMMLSIPLMFIGLPPSRPFKTLHNQACEWNGNPQDFVNFIGQTRADLFNPLATFYNALVPWINTVATPLSQCINKAPLVTAMIIALSILVLHVGTVMLSRIVKLLFSYVKYAVLMGCILSCSVCMFAAAAYIMLQPFLNAFAPLS